MTLTAPVAAAESACTPDAGYTDCVQFTYEGTDQTFTVPDDGITEIFAKVWGAGGGGGSTDFQNQFTAGGGGFSTGTLAVSPGDELTVVVGQGGLPAGFSAASLVPTYGGGGAGGDGDAEGASGGGLSGLLDTTDTPILIAGGGGGATRGAATTTNTIVDAVNVHGGAGGGTSGLVDGTPNSGGGGTQSAGGSAGQQLADPCAIPATAGAQFQGGTGGGGSTGSTEAGGGGGGGYFGGGGGRCQPVATNSPPGSRQNGAGGGGSGFVGATVTGGSTVGGNPSTTLGVGGLAAGNTDARFVTGVGKGGDFGPGGNGLVVLQWKKKISLTVEKNADRADYTPGEALTYTIEVGNGGPSKATGVGVADPLGGPTANFTWTCTATAGSSCPNPASGSGPLDTTVDIAKDGKVTFTITGTVPSDATENPLENTTTVTKPPKTIDEGCDPTCTDDTSLPVNPKTSPKVVKTVDSQSYKPGQKLTYTIVASNGGPSDAPGVKILDKVPPALAAFTWECVATAPSVCNAPTNGVGGVDTTADIVAGGEVTITMTGTVPAGTTGDLENVASVENDDCAPGACTATTVVKPPLPVTGMPLYWLVAAGAAMVVGGAALLHKAVRMR